MEECSGSSHYDSRLPDEGSFLEVFKHLKEASDYDHAGGDGGNDETVPEGNYDGEYEEDYPSASELGDLYESDTRRKDPLEDIDLLIRQFERKRKQDEETE